MIEYNPSTNPIIRTLSIFVNRLEEKKSSPRLVFPPKCIVDKRNCAALGFFQGWGHERLTSAQKRAKMINSVPHKERLINGYVSS